MSVGMAPQLIARMRCSRRGLAQWIALATSSLPVPLSPTTSTLDRVGATNRICSNSRSIGADLPMMLSKPYRLSSICLRLLTSSLSWRFSSMDGIEFLRQLRERGSDLAVILVTGFGSLETAVEAMRVGADDYLTKPVDLYELRKRVMNLLENRQLKEEVSNLRQMLDKRYGFESIIGRSEAMEHLFEQMKMVAPTRSSVLIVGESGTGKELSSPLP